MCSCVDYQEGHLCKHCHKVKATTSGEDQSSSPDILSEPLLFNQPSGSSKHLSKTYNNHCHQCLLNPSDSLISAKHLAVESETNRVLTLSREVNDPHLLDHALATLSMLASSLQAHVTDKTRNSEAEIESNSFKVVDKFAPAEKNETQPRFKKTTDTAGRKQKMISLKYVTFQ